MNMNHVVKVTILILIGRDKFISNKKFSILCGAEGIRGWFYILQIIGHIGHIGRIGRIGRIGHIG